MKSSRKGRKQYEQSQALGWLDKAVAEAKHKAIVVTRKELLEMAAKWLPKLDQSLRRNPKPNRMYHSLSPDLRESYMAMCAAVNAAIRGTYRTEHGKRDLLQKTADAHLRRWIRRHIRDEIEWRSKYFPEIFGGIQQTPLARELLEAARTVMLPAYPPDAVPTLPRLREVSRMIGHICRGRSGPDTMSMTAMKRLDREEGREGEMGITGK